MYKKHVNQMTSLEKEVLLSRLKEGKFYYFTDYSVTRLRERGIFKYEVMDTIENGVLIEYHRKGQDHRILLRGLTPNIVGEVTCVVLSLCSFTVITAYKNDFFDIHLSLKQDNYCDNLNICENLPWLINRECV